MFSNRSDESFYILHFPGGAVKAQSKGIEREVLNWMICRGVAQPGSAPALGAGGRAFKSPRPDQTLHLQ